MRTLIAFVVTLSIIVLPPSVTSAADDGVGARGLFIQSRPKQRTQKARPKSAAADRPPIGADPTKPPPSANGNQSTVDGPLGLGLSLFRVINQAEPIRVDPASMFRSGDAIRFVIEPAIDGYLYVFLRTGERTPVMIYPDARLEQGDNFVYAHTVTEVPSRRNREFDVFRLTGSPAVEHITIVLTRTPLPGVPIADALVAHCASSSGVCLWQPQPETVAEVKGAAAKPSLVSAVKDAGRRLSKDDAQMLARDLVLGASDDAPSIVAVAGSVDTPLFAYEVTIRHEK